MPNLSGLVLLMLSLDGCYSWHAIRPTELPKLNGGSTTVTNAGGRQVALVTVAKVETVDGLMVEITGASDARVSVRGGAPVLFERPESAIEAGALSIRSLNRAKTTIPLDNIQRVEVSRYELVQSSLAYMLPGLALLAVVLVVM